MAGKNSKSDRTRAYKTTAASTGRSSTRRFPTAKSGRPRTPLAREKQRRQYEQQKREKLIFALFVVIILVMILFAILIFKKIVGDMPGGPQDTTDPATTTGPADVSSIGDKTASTFRTEMVAKDRLYQGSLIYVKKGEKTAVAPTLTNLQEIADRTYAMSGNGDYLEAAAATAFADMAAKQYAATGKKLTVQNCCAPSDTGEFSTGLLLDISLSIDGSTYLISDYDDVFAWLSNHATDFGFAMMTPEETGRRHYGFRYVGIPHAYYMEENNLTLSAYLDLLRSSHDLSDAADSSTAASALRIETGGISYQIYYVKCDGGDMTEIPILSSAISYTVSGDNMGGFIVTVVTA